jgi:VanZ family protein/glutaredoxin
LSRILRFATLWVPVALYGAAVYYLSSLSQVAVVGRLPDYLTHPVEYGGLTILIVRAMNGGLRRPIPQRVHVGAVALAVLYAVTDEIHQLHVPRRTASVKDVLSDALGAVLAVGLAEILQRFLERRRKVLEISLYTRRDCHLCHEARDILTRISREIPLRVTEVDVDADPNLARLYQLEVPVLMAGGVKISKLRPDEAVIRRRLERLAPQGG